jgi:hypothetical protein
MILTAVLIKFIVVAVSDAVSTDRRLFAVERLQVRNLEFIITKQFAYQNRRLSECNYPL